LAERAQRIGLAVLSVDVSDDNGTECDYKYVEQTDCVSQCAEDATSDDCCCIEMDATDACFRWKGQDEGGEVNGSTHV
jgi:hypothetical protein